MVYPDEHVDDLQLDGLKIIQKNKGFKFGVDAVLLADFAACKKGSKIAELCSGSGIVSVLAAHHYENVKIDAVELLPKYADMAERTVEMNGQQCEIKIHCADLKNAPSFLKCCSYDYVLCNPPYKKVDAGENCPDADKAAARSEIHATLEDVIRTSSLLLKESGRLCMVHRPHRLNDIVLTLAKYKFALKRLCTVSSRFGEAPVLILCEAYKNGKSDMVIDPPIILYDKDGETARTKEIYRRSDR